MSSSTATTGRTGGGTTTRQSPERSKDRILAAAADLARERGVTGATIAQVCKRSGLPVSSVYWHFEDKDGLFAEVVRWSFAKWLIAVPRWDVEDGASVEQSLHRILGASTSTFSDVPPFLRVGMQVLLETGEQNLKTRRAFLETRDQVHRLIGAWMARFLDEADGPADRADDMATLVVAFADGMLVGSQLYPDWDPDWDPGGYVDLMSRTLADSLEVLAEG